MDTPALVVYPERANENIRILKSFVPDTDRLFPHVKTHKSSEITKMMMKAGIRQFKCATIAEAEMLAMSGARNILLAYQPAGPKVERLLKLVLKYPVSIFSCIIDNLESAKTIAAAFKKAYTSIDVLIDLNVGMNRTGISPTHALNLYENCEVLNGIKIVGLHAYDGHLREPDLTIRTQQCDAAFAPVKNLQEVIEQKTGRLLQIVAGGTPSFPIHAKREDVICSPGTFVYWDKGYQLGLAEQPFLFAALVITRIVSKPTDDTICIDLGHKSIASESTLDKRIFFLNAEGLTPIGHSEEHMVLKTDKSRSYNIGDVLYGVPYHICPTVALHDRVSVVDNQNVSGQWLTLSRNRTIGV